METTWAGRLRCRIFLPDQSEVKWERRGFYSPDALRQANLYDRRDDPVFDRALDLLEWALPSLLMPERRFAEGAA